MIANKWYGSIGLGQDRWCWTLNICYALPLVFNGPLKFICDPHITFTNSPFVRNTAHVDTSRLIISTCWFPKFSFSDQSQYALRLFLVSYWLNALPFPVSKGNGRNSRYNRKTASVSLSVPQIRQEKSDSIGMMKYCSCTVRLCYKTSNYKTPNYKTSKIQKVKLQNADYKTSKVTKGRITKHRITKRRKLQKVE